MLFAFLRWLIGSPAPKTHKRQERDYVTREQLDEIMGEYSKKTEWVLDEWYEKFNTLHARLAKRAQRAAPPPPANGVEQEEQTQLPSVLQFRRLGSP